MKFTFFSLILLVLFGCSTTEKLIRDSRYNFTNALKWETNFSYNDSSSGIIFKFVKENDTRIPEGANIFLWKYPLDTSTIVKKVFNEMQPMPSVGFADVTYIYYKINNDTIKINSALDSSSQITRDIQPGRYLILVLSTGFSRAYIKDIIVVEGFWSIVDIKMREEPILLY